MLIYFVFDSLTPFLCEKVLFLLCRNEKISSKVHLNMLFTKEFEILLLMRFYSHKKTIRIYKTLKMQLFKKRYF